MFDYDDFNLSFFNIWHRYVFYFDQITTLSRPSSHGWKSTSRVGLMLSNVSLNAGKKRIIGFCCNPGSTNQKTD